MNGDERMLPGGVYCEGNTDDDRTDFYLTEIGTGETGNPKCFNLHLVTGNCDVTVVSLMPDDVKRLGKWLVEMSELNSVNVEVPQ